ncbi:MAG TPA: GNAT family N-acetyltransferase [Acidimicrobiia bacterium]|nr:GNAT family N-acetyltransferase [Acidimicrobiia bacterium]
MRVEIRRIRADEGPVLMRVRLLSLLDAPYAFGATYTDTIQRPAEHWAKRAETASAGGTSAVYLGMADGSPVAIAGAFQPEDDPDCRHVFGVWVEPALRGQGLGRRIVETVVSWAEGVGATRTELWVTEANTPAVELYEALGFEDSGQRQAHPSDPTVMERKLVRRADRARSA